MIHIHKCEQCDEARSKGGEFCERHTKKAGLRERRKALGKTMGEIADLLGVSATYISDAERYPELHPSKVKNVGDCLLELERKRAQPKPPAQEKPQPPRCESCDGPTQSPFTQCLACRHASADAQHEEDRKRRAAEAEEEVAK